MKNKIKVYVYLLYSKKTGTLFGMTSFFKNTDYTSEDIRLVAEGVIEFPQETSAKPEPLEEQGCSIKENMGDLD